MLRLFRLTLVIAFAAGVTDVRAQNPDPNLEPTYGSVKLTAGFLPDPVIKSVQAGGELRTNLGGVKTHVAKAPDFSVEYAAGKYPLLFSVKSAGDTTLLINLPDGSWLADDDSGGGLDPLIRIAKPQSGRYDIYVGSFRGDILEAKLHITEREAAVAKKPSVPFNPSLPECHIVSAGIDDYRHEAKLSGCLNDARNTVAAFQAHTGTMFRAVKDRVLLDENASHGGIIAAFRGMTTQGAPGDYMVLFLSGHGARTNGNKGKTWFFLPVDFNNQRFQNTALTDLQLLDIADQLVRQKKNVVLVVDACFSGQLAVTAQPFLNRYQTSKDGSLTLMLSSAPHQTSAALGNYSAYAKAFADSMLGAADLNKDMKITLGEIQSYSPKRTAGLLTASRNPNKQDPVVTWSPSLTKDSPLGILVKSDVQVAAAPVEMPAGKPRRFVGNETLQGYGKLAFALYPNGHATMTDAQNTMDGIWRIQGNRYVLSFADGSIRYTGTLKGTTLSGSATSPSTRQQAVQSWTWSVQLQPG